MKEKLTYTQIIKDIKVTEPTCINCKNKLSENECLSIIQTNINHGVSYCDQDITKFLCLDCERFKNEYQTYISSFECEA